MAIDGKICGAGSVRGWQPGGLLERAAAAYLLAEGVGGLAWWTALMVWPGTRAAFKAAESPDATLLAFAAADLLLFAGGALAASFGVWRRRNWAWPVLCVHTGAAAYASLYCLQLAWLAPEAWLGAALMAPSLLIPGLIAWKLRPAGDRRVS